MAHGRPRAVIHDLGRVGPGAVQCLEFGGCAGLADDCRLRAGDRGAGVENLHQPVFQLQLRRRACPLFGRKPVNVRERPACGKCGSRSGSDARVKPRGTLLCCCAVCPPQRELWANHSWLQVAEAAAPLCRAGLARAAPFLRQPVASADRQAGEARGRGGQPAPQLRSPRAARAVARLDLLVELRVPRSPEGRLDGEVARTARPAARAVAARSAAGTR